MLKLLSSLILIFCISTSAMAAKVGDKTTFSFGCKDKEVMLSLADSLDTDPDKFLVEVRPYLFSGQCVFIPSPARKEKDITLIKLVDHIQHTDIFETDINLYIMAQEEPHKDS